MTQARVRRARRALLAAAFSLPFSTTATAVEIYYARAIGDPYEYRPLPAPAGPVEPAAARDPALPGLGTEAAAPAAAEGGWTWPRVLVGVLVVGAIAALANNGGGGEAGVEVSAAGSTPPAAPPAPAPSGGAPSGGRDSGGGGAPTPSGDSPAPAPSGGTPSGGGGSGGGGGDEGRGGEDGKGGHKDKGNKDKGGKGRGKGK